MLFGVMLFVHLDVAVVRAQSNLPGIATLNDESSASDSETPPADGSSGEESLSDILDGDVEPKILRRPLLPSDQESLPSDQPDLDQWVDPIFDAPTGYTGMSGIAPLESQTSGHFVPVEDRWRAGFPEWDRYGKGYVLVAEEFALEQIVGKRGAMHRDKGSARPGARLVNGLRDQLLAGA